MTLRLTGEMGPLHSAAFVARSLGEVSRESGTPHYHVTVRARTSKSLEKKVAALKALMPRIVGAHPLVSVTPSDT